MTLNIGVLSNSNALRSYVDTFHQYGFINEIILSTYVSPSTGIHTSLSDHLWHNLNCSRRSYLVTPALSDHCAICVTFRINHDRPPLSITFREFGESNAEVFASHLESEFISCSTPHSNPNRYADYLVLFWKKNEQVFPDQT